jgi:hypothetical protein
MTAPSLDDLAHLARRTPAPKGHAKARAVVRFDRSELHRLDALDGSSRAAIVRAFVLCGLAMMESTPVQTPEGEDVLAIMADVMDREARVHRAESALNRARRRLGEAVDRLIGARQSGAAVPPLGAALLEHHGGVSVSPEPREMPPGTLRERIVAALAAEPGETFTVARVALALDHDNRDSIRNALLVLASAGRVEKVGIGEYRAKKEGAS